VSFLQPRRCLCITADALLPLQSLHFLAARHAIVGIAVAADAAAHATHHRFNWRSAGVGSSLLFVSVAGAYSPSIFQTVFGSHDFHCLSCEDKLPPNGSNSVGANFTTQMVLNNAVKAVTVLMDGIPMSCSQCSYKQSALSLVRAGGPCNTHWKPTSALTPLAGCVSCYQFALFSLWQLQGTLSLAYCVVLMVMMASASDVRIRSTIPRQSTLSTCVP